MKTLTRYKPILVLLIIYGGILLFLFGTSPQHLPLVLIITPLVLIFLAIFYTVYLVLKVKKNDAWNKRQRIVVASFSATIPVLLLSFQSVHQLTIRDVLLGVALILTAFFYVSKIDFL